MRGAAAGEFVLGLDGGGTHTRFALANRDAAVIATGRGETVDPYAERTTWPDRLADAVRPADGFRDRLAAATLGLPCHGEVAEVSEWQRAVADHLIEAPHEVVNDVQAAFEGALVGVPGILLLSGTGSMAWAGDGSTQMRLGGWGETFGDEGSAHWIGREALSEATQALDGRQRSRDFARTLLEGLGVEADGLLAWCYAQPSRRAAIAGLAAIVDTLAETGDLQARTLLIRAADYLSDHASACAVALRLERPFRWSYAGGVFRSRTIMMRLRERLGSAPSEPRLPPVGGALLRAARLAGWIIDDAWVDRLAASLSIGEDAQPLNFKGEQP